MNKIKKKFKESYNNITINPDFSKIKNQIEYRSNLKEEKNKGLIPTFISISFSLLLIVTFSLIIVNKNQTNNTSDLSDVNYQDFVNYQVTFTPKNDAIMQNDKINIDLPMMYNAYNFNDEIDANTSWDVFKDGVKQDKDHLDLKLGNNNFNVVVYKLNKVDKTYQLNINVGK